MFFHGEKFVKFGGKVQKVFFDTLINSSNPWTRTKTGKNLIKGVRSMWHFLSIQKHLDLSSKKYSLNLKSRRLSTAIGDFPTKRSFHWLKTLLMFSWREKSQMHVIIARESHFLGKFLPLRKHEVDSELVYT